ncbi:hypothetical protein [Anaerovibrio sp.]|uniref:hypothetical protein n=1 Tax=Anaerovibrio sp. TaxID=1872532 RepID=UPI00389002FE
MLLKDMDPKALDFMNNYLLEIITGEKYAEFDSKTIEEKLTTMGDKVCLTGVFLFIIKFCLLNGTFYGLFQQE